MVSYQSGAAVAPVPIDFFDAFGVPLLTGRSFRPGDARGDASAVIVNTAFVDRLLGGGPELSGHGIAGGVGPLVDGPLPRHEICRLLAKVDRLIPNSLQCA